MGGTALPNLHPAIIHFPVALLVVALGFDAACLVRQRLLWLDRAAAALFVLGAIGAWAAVVTGERAADSLLGVPANVHPLIGVHHDWAVRTAWLFTAIALARAALAWADRTAGALRRVPIRAVVVAAALAGQGLLVGTADRGGALVYRHGLAVQGFDARHEEEGETARVSVVEPPEARLVRQEGGGLVWTPVPGDVDAIGSVLQPVERSGALRAVAGVDALRLEATGRSLWVLPGEFGDVQIEVTVDLSEFRGTFGVGHHVRSLEEGGLFELSTDGAALLVSTVSGRRNVLDQGVWEPSEGDITLGVSAAGRHLKGLVNGATITHGHGDVPAPGSVGILLEGEGVVRIRSLRVLPL